MLLLDSNQNYEFNAQGPGARPSSKYNFPLDIKRQYMTEKLGTK